MTRSRFATALVLAALGANTAPLAAQNYTDLDRQRAQLMLDVIGKDLLKYYYDSTYGGVPLQTIIDSTRAQLGRSQSNEQSFGLIGRVFLSLGNSQTYFIPPARTTTFDYGWEFQCIGDSAFITRVDSNSDAARQGIRVGDRVLGLNGVAVHRLDFSRYMYVLNVLQPRDHLVLTVASDTGSPRNVMVATKLTPGKRIYDVSGFGGIGDRLQFLLADQAAWERSEIRLADVTPNILLWHMYAMHVSDRDLYSALGRAARSGTLILDLRYNVGGGWAVTSKLLNAIAPDSDAGALIGRFVVRDPSQASTLVGELVGKEFRDSLYLRPDAHHRFGGRLIVLVDSKTFGMGEVIADVVSRYHLGTVIGDRTAGTDTFARLVRYGTPGYTAELYGAVIGMADFRGGDGTRIEGVGVTPDETILPTAEDLRNRRDPALARALTLAGHPVSAAEAGAIAEQVAVH